MYTIDDKVILWLSSFEFMSYKKAMQIIDLFDLDDLFNNLKEYRADLLKIVKAQEFDEMLTNNNLMYVDSIIRGYDEHLIKAITYKSDDYPRLLKEIDSPPLILYCKGNISLLNSDCLAVVGTRRATNYGKTACKKIVNEVATQGITIVSGLAEGIDTIAHKSTLEVKGKTIAVLGSGLLHIYPASNEALYKDILDNDGLIISEYKPNEPSVTYHFPVRNRIIAGLSKAVAIMEATEKSGSMHTKNYALEYNREVFALPAKVGDIYSEGCNKMIQNGQAKMVLASKDIMEFFGKSNNYFKTDTVLELTFDEQIIYDTLVGNELHFDEIAEKTKLDTKILLTMLMRLEIKGIITKMPGNMYMITNK